jgi:hypothetical protein
LDDNQEATINGRFRWALIELLYYCDEQQLGPDQRFWSFFNFASLPALAK